MTVAVPYGAAVMRMGGTLLDGSTAATAFNFNTDTYTAMLLLATYVTPDTDAQRSTVVDTHVFVSSAVASEVSGAGYARKNLTNPTWTYQDTPTPENTGKLDDGGTNAPTVFASFTAPAAGFRYAAVFKNTGSDATSPLLLLVDFETAQNASLTATFTITWSTNGILRLKSTVPSTFVG